MKKVFLLLALVFLCNRLPAANYYVSTTGTDSPANGTAGNPWRTIRYACQQAAANSGHVINVAAGNYTETDIINIPSGVSVIGAGQAATYVTVNKYFNILNYGTTCSGAPDTSYDPYNEQFVIQVNGSNQTIKGFTLDGQSKACHGGIYALTANYCVFEDLKIQYFRFSGLWVENSINTEIRNSHFRNNTFANKACDTGNIQFHYNTNLLIHDNYIKEDGAIGGTKGGYGIKAYSGTYTNFCWWQWWAWNWSHYADGMKIYNNYIDVPELGGWETGAGAGVPAIAIEINGLSSRNVEIYNNYINNHISLIGGYNNETDPMVRVHNNFFDLGARYAYAVEANVINLEIDHNYIFGGLYPIAQWEGGRTNYRNHSIHHNIFYDQWNGQALTRYETGVDGFKFYHNTVVDSKGISTLFDVAGGNHYNSDVRNNIFTSTYGSRGGLYNAGETAGTIAYNLFNNINAVGSNSITGSPLLVWSGNKPAPFFELQSGSPARNTGVYIAGINNGYLESAPDMGAYEYGAAPFPVGTIAAGTPTTVPTVTRTATRTATPTPRPTVACNAPYTIEAESYSADNGVLNKGNAIGNCDPGDWVRYSAINFCGTYTVFKTLMAVDPGFAGKTVEVRLDSAAGTLAGTLTTVSTGSWTVFVEQSTTLSGITGTHDIYIVFGGASAGVGDFDWFKFETAGTVTPTATRTPIMPTATYTATPAGGCNFYVSLSGNDSTGNGSAGKPWRTVAYACSQVPANNGCVINVGPGTFWETTAANMPSGTTLTGAGKTSTIITANAYPIFRITNGQNIVMHSFTLDGRNKALWQAMDIATINNFEMYDFDVKEFGYWTNVEPYVYISTIKINYGSNISIHDFTGTNASQGHNAMFGFGKSATDVEIYNGNVVNSEASHGKIVGAGGDDGGARAPLTRIKIHDNTFYTASVGQWEIPGTGIFPPQIVIEFWHVMLDNCEIYNNNFNANVSIQSNGYDYPAGAAQKTLRIHHNSWNNDRATGYQYAIETSNDNNEIDHNYIYEGAYAIASFGEWGAKPLKNIKIHHNVFEAQSISTLLVNMTGNVENISFCNNTARLTSGNGLFGVGGTVNGFNITNNIFYQSGAYSDSLNLGGATIAYNHFYNMAAKGTNALTSNPSLVFSGIKPDPYFRLNAGSPAIDSGTVIPGITDGYSGAAPDRGAYESGPAGSPTNSATITRTATRTPTPTPRPTVACNAPYIIEAESFNAMNAVTNKGAVIGDCDPGDWVRYSGINFCGTYTVFKTLAAIDTGFGGKNVEIRLDSPTGTLAGTLTTVATGGWTTFVEQSTAIAGITGTHDVYIVFGGASPGVGDFDWFRFEAAATPTVTITVSSSQSPVSSSTPTPTQTRTPSVTPTVSLTMTITITYHSTSTPTATKTSSSVHTSTVTPVNTVTATRTTNPSSTSTRTATAIPTATFTQVNTQTFTVTRTSSSTMTITITNTPVLTFTRTNSPTMTITYNLSPSFTATGTNTAVITATNTLVNTATRTAVNTATQTPVNSATSTPVNTPASTPVNTMTSTFVNTATATPVSTAVSTAVNTATVTPINTAIATAVNTAAATPVNTQVNTAISTATRTAVNTATATPVNTSTATPINTAVSTPVTTASSTAVNTATGTAVNTATATRTCTNSITMTIAITITNTPAITFTRTSSPTTTSTRVSTPVYTSTSTRTATALPSPTATTAWEDKFEITETLPFPNPFSNDSGLSILFYVTRTAAKVSVRIYTASFRLVDEMTFPGPFNGDSVILIPAYKISGLAAGVYYIKFWAEAPGEKTTARIQQVIKLR